MVGIDYALKISDIKPKDEKFHAMVQIAKNCKVLRIDAPKEVLEYFGISSIYELEVVGDEVSQKLVYLNIMNSEHAEDEEMPFAKKFENVSSGGSHETGYIIDIEKIPKDFQYLVVSGKIY